MIDFSVETKKRREVVDITDIVNRHCRETGVDVGWCHMATLHTTVALAVADLDPGTDLDMLDAFEELIPKLGYRHPHDPSHVPDHILSTLIGTSLSLPVEEGRVMLGTWQRVVLFEFNGPKERYFKISTISDGS